MVHPVFIQTFYYSIVLVIAFFFISLIQRGFFWKFIRVKLSFGRLVLVKLREINRDDYKVGKVQEGFLVFKDGKNQKRTAIKDSSLFYRSIGCVWVDYDSEKNALVRPDFSTIEGFDAAKYDNLYQRALTRPSVTDRKEQIMLIMLGASLLMLAATLYLLYNQYNDVGLIKAQVDTMKPIVEALQQGVVTPGS